MAQARACVKESTNLLHCKLGVQPPKHEWPVGVRVTLCLCPFSVSMTCCTRGGGTRSLGTTLFDMSMRTRDLATRHAGIRSWSQHLRPCFQSRSGRALRPAGTGIGAGAHAGFLVVRPGSAQAGGSVLPNGNSPLAQRPFCTRACTGSCQTLSLLTGRCKCTLRLLL